MTHEEMKQLESDVAELADVAADRNLDLALDILNSTRRTLAWHGVDTPNIDRVAENIETYM